MNARIVARGWLLTSLFAMGSLSSGADARPRKPPADIAPPPAAPLVAGSAGTASSSSAAGTTPSAAADSAPSAAPPAAGSGASAVPAPPRAVVDEAFKALGLPPSPADAAAPSGASSEPPPASDDTGARAAGSTPVSSPAPSANPRPFVRGGIYDKPYLSGVTRWTRLGGYADVQLRHERADGAVEETTFVPKRFNLFTFTPVSDRVRVAAEVELEDGAEEIALETAVVDVELHEAATFRGGVILSPLGRFNLAHDSPANDLVDRPLVSTDLLGATLSEAGMGFWGTVESALIAPSLPLPDARLTYELYLVNGFGEGVLLGSPDGTRIAEGKGTFEDENGSPAFVGRLGLSPIPDVDVGFSGHRGAYNVYRLEGVAIDERRSLAIVAVDGEARRGPLAIAGELAYTFVDVPASMRDVNASRQSGFFLEGRYRFLDGAIRTMPTSSFAATLRLERVDFDRDRDGDDHGRLTLGLSFRPIPETVLKLDYRRESVRDRFNLETPGAAVLFGLASYF